MSEKWTLAEGIYNASWTIHPASECKELCITCSDRPTERVYLVRRASSEGGDERSQVAACCEACALTWIYRQVPLHKQITLRQNADKPSLRLTIELVPSPCWYSNMRTKVSRTTWDKIRRQVYAEYHYRCGICQAEHVTLHCHEIWQYDDEQHIQKLAGFIALCEMCHHCKHIGLAGIRASEGTLDFAHVVSHFMQVNQCSQEEYQAHSQEAWDLWRERNQHQWTTDLGAYAQLVNKGMR